MITKKNLLIKARKALKSNGNTISFPKDSNMPVYLYGHLTMTTFLDMILTSNGKIVVYSRPFYAKEDKEDADYLETFDIDEMINILKLAKIK